MLLNRAFLDFCRYQCTLALFSSLTFTRAFRQQHKVVLLLPLGTFYANSYWLVPARCLDGSPRKPMSPAKRKRNLGFLAEKDFMPP